jgi:hypothetical protein
MNAFINLLSFNLSCYYLIVPYCYEHGWHAFMMLNIYLTVGPRNSASQHGMIMEEV